MAKGLRRERTVDRDEGPVREACHRAPRDSSTEDSEIGRNPPFQFTVLSVPSLMGL